MTDEEALMQVVAMLAKEEISTQVTSNGKGGLRAFFVDGFYKSDGIAYLEPRNGRLFLLSRYEQCDEINGLADIAAASKDWHEYSKDRFEGWENPPSHWAAFYAKFQTEQV